MTLIPKTLAGRFLTVIVCAVFVAQTLVFSLLLFETDSKIDQYERAFIVDRIASIFSYSSEGDTESRQLIFEAASNLDMTFKSVQSPTGLPLAKAESSLFHALGDRVNAPIQVLVRPVRFWDTLRFWFQDGSDSCFLSTNISPVKMKCPFWQVSVQYPDGKWLQATGLPSPEANLILAPLFLSVLMSLLGITIVVAWLARRLVAPLRQLSYAADCIGRGEDFAPLRETGPEELSKVISAFNAMQDRVTRFVHDRTMMLAAISHDLRTPITSLRLRAEFIEDDKLHDKMVESLDDMQVMVESFLTFAREDVADEIQQEFDLVGLCTRMAAETGGMTFKTGEETCLFCGRKIGVQRALANLVGNAIKYGGKADVCLMVEADQIRITIDDAGAGVPEANFEEIFVPFTRMDQARSVVEGSVGLGLSIARSIIRKQGGDISPQNLPNGFRMTVALPWSY